MYSTPLQIASEAKIQGEFTADTLPTLSKVVEIIEEVDAEINARLSTRYVLPIGGTTNLLILRAISIALSTERVRAIMDADAPSETNDEVASRDAKREGKNARARLAELAGGTLVLGLPDVTLDNGGVSRAYASYNGYRPYFDRSKQQW